MPIERFRKYTDTQIAYATAIDNGNSDRALSIAINNPDEFDWCGERPEGFGEPHGDLLDILMRAARVDYSGAGK